MKRKRRKIKTHERNGISIRELSPEYFQVDFMRDGKRERKGFKTLLEAERHCEDVTSKLRTEGSSILLMTAKQREDAMTALRVLDGRASLTNTAHFWMKHNAAGEGTPLADVGEKWFAALRRSGCRETTLRERRHKVGRLTKVFGNRPAASIMTEDLLGLMDSLKVTGVTADGYRRCWHALYTYAISEGIAEVNPVAKIKPFKADERLPKPFTVKDVRAIMSAAEEYAPPLVVTLAVQFFGGLRPGEAMGLKWEDVDFMEKTIRVLPEVSKMRRSRLVDINDTLAAWLRRYRKQSGPVGIISNGQFGFIMHRKPIGPAYRQKGIPIKDRPEDKRPKGLLAAARVDWIQDGPRKSFASYHYATYQDQAKLAATLGHTGDANVLYKHYRGLVTKKAAGEYWQLRPASKKAGNLIQFEKAVS